MTIARPAETECAPFYAGYIATVGDRGPLAFLTAQVAEFEQLRGLPEAKGDFRYADGKWSVKEVLGHLADAERVFAYRLLRIARADKTALAGFDENAWAEVAPHGRRTMVQVVDDLIAVRRATITLVESLDETAVANVGVANNNPVTGRAICWIVPGHAQHHLGILAERYNLGS
ncbi:MAG: squalene--hopene cyclase [Acidobacterium sp.]|nr:DinB family protein [Acidobacteriota bacterium]PHY10285.1 MAG: squalene--hopene cyclase [Acidobacterium sp.]